MIIRIATEGQYEVKGDVLGQLDEMDDLVLDAIDEDSPEAFSDALDKVLDLIRAKGVRLPDANLEVSDLILPPPDMSFAEAKDLLNDYPRDLI